jgi:hypothetical protein
LIVVAHVIVPPWGLGGLSADNSGVFSIHFNDKISGVRAAYADQCADFQNRIVNFPDRLVFSVLMVAGWAFLDLRLVAHVIVPPSGLGPFCLAQQNGRKLGLNETYLLASCRGLDVHPVKLFRCRFAYLLQFAFLVNVVKGTRAKIVINIAIPPLVLTDN